MKVILSLGLALGLASSSFASDKDIVDTAVAAGSFKTLVAAVQAAGLVDTLKGPGPFTVFAPTDEAFARLPAGTVESLLKPENKDKLVAILTYHVVAGKVLAADVVKLNGQSARTVQGAAAPIKVDGGTVFVGSAKVLKTDIEATNGVIHVIDTVLMPPAARAPTPVTAAPVASVSYPAAYGYAPAPAVHPMPCPVESSRSQPARGMRLFRRGR